MTLHAHFLKRSTVIEELGRVRDFAHAVARGVEASKIDSAAADVLARHLDGSRQHHGSPSPEQVSPEERFRFTARDRVTSLLQSAMEQHAEAEGDAFTTADPRWVPEISDALVKRLLHHGNHEFNPEPAPPLTIGANARLVVFGDWGTGLPGARDVAKQARAKLLEARAEGRDAVALHLGDVCYSGEPDEVRKRVLADGFWSAAPSEAGTIVSYALAGNHDMYSGGFGYFDTLLADDRFRPQRTPDGKGTSFFDIVNDDWKLIGLDTAFDDRVLWHGAWGRPHGPQADHVNAAAAADGGRSLFLRSHHQFVTVYDKRGVTPTFERKLGSALVAAWMWGHEHRCRTFEPHRKVDHLCCNGHAGTRVMAHAPSDPLPFPGRWEWREQYESDGDRWLVFGFAVLDFDGPAIDVAYVDQAGVVQHQERIVRPAGAAERGPP